ncbi:MAG: sporulation protein YunB [Oscillospiraceae bacterium]
MVYRKFLRNTGKKRGKTNLFFVIFFCLVALIMIMDYKIRPVISKASAYQAKYIVSNVIAQAANLTLNKENITYQDLIKIDKNSNQEITSVSSDSYLINKIKIDAIKNINSRLANLKNEMYEIPIGTLLPIEYFQGRGSMVSFKLTQVGYTNAEIISKFESTGINQTHHKIILQVQTNVTSLIPFHSSDCTVTTDFLIAETVIVGKVPNFYSNLEL